MDYPHRHLTVSAHQRAFRFKGIGHGDRDLRSVNRIVHAAELQRQIDAIDEEFSAVAEQRKVENLPREFGLLLNIESAPDYPLKLDALEKKPSRKQDGIYLLNVRRRKDDAGTVTCATVMVPYGQLTVLAKKIEQFADPARDSEKKDGTKTPRNAALLANIDAIAVAAFDALWTEDTPLPPAEELRWWELWISRAPRAENAGQSWIQRFNQICEQMGLKPNQFRQLLPDNEIVILKATRAHLESSLDLLNTLTEIRGVHPYAIDLSDLSAVEQLEWIEESESRIIPPPPDAPAVCLLDTGVNRSHPLLRIILNENGMYTVLPHMGAADHPHNNAAHGTPMAGIAGYGDLRNLLLSTGRWYQQHQLESVKLIQDGDEHKPEAYGAATQQALAYPEGRFHDRNRVFCLAITLRDYSTNGLPSSWSAGIDAGASGATEEMNPGRVICVSAGNCRSFGDDYEYDATNLNLPIEDPAQAWNGISVGAMTRMSQLSQADTETEPLRTVAPSEQLSPFSRTSTNWEPQWPIKPDVVMEGGNIAQNKSGDYEDRESLQLVTTAAHYHKKPLTNINGTSAATASVSRLGAMLMSRMPGYWPETYRGLIVHSARWLPSMLQGMNPHAPGNTQIVQQVMRQYGYGEPHSARLFGSGEGGVTMIIQDELQPYNPDSKAGSASLGYFNLHDIPWPRDVFRQYRDLDLTLRVTLSYFIEPNPGTKCWVKGSKYRYASHLLRFTVKRATEDEGRFIKSLEKRVAEEENDDEKNEGRAQADAKWALGPQLRKKGGSLVQDIWKGTPADLAEMGQIVVYPAKGWFATRSFPLDHEYYDCHKRKVRYSLIVSIDAEQEIGLYTSISNMISVDVQ